MKHKLLYLIKEESKKHSSPHIIWHAMQIPQQLNKGVEI